MKRQEMINAIGMIYFVSNTENGEWSYPKAMKEAGKTIDPDLISSTIENKKHHFLDIRFVYGDVSILIETKANFDKCVRAEVEKQLQAYVNYEKVLTGNKIVAILANTEDDRLQVWWGSNIKIDESHRLSHQYTLLSFDDYYDLYHGKENNREKVLRSTYELNELLHKHGVNEKIRAQFVGTCLLALKHNLQYKNLSTKQILGGISEILNSMLERDLSRNEKIIILDNILKSQNISELSKEAIGEIVSAVDRNILPYINDRNTMGQDLLNLFFTTFNKYVGKSDKNQAFTPDHIAHFMCKVLGINRNSVVLDPCCGSGSFLVRAMTEAIDDCSCEEEKNTVKKKHIFGIESEENVFGLATTNMLIHGDGNSNVRKGSCFHLGDWITEAHIDSVLMNPPYNAQRRYCNEEYVKNWKADTKEDPSKGFHYVYYIASIVKKGRLAVLLPMQCAIGNSTEIQKFKELMLQDHTLDAVFSLPPDVFHPGASASACCMVFNLGVRHEKAQHQETFFGYFKDDGFVKRKNLGRVERTKKDSDEGIWSDIESHWLDLYHNRKAEKGLSVTHKVTAQDEWLAEAYMETDYSTLTEHDFEKTVRQFLAFQIANGETHDWAYSEKRKQASLCKKSHSDALHSISLSEFNLDNWKYFNITKLFNELVRGKVSNTDLLEEGNDCLYVGAKRENNGVIKRCLYDENLISKGNCIVFICDGQGSVGYANYMDRDFMATTNLTLGYRSDLNKARGIFIATVASLERPRYSYGRKWHAHLPETRIKLPATATGEPDWDYMENYIKSLPYGDCI